MSFPNMTWREQLMIPRPLAESIKINSLAKATLAALECAYEGSNLPCELSPEATANINKSIEVYETYEKELGNAVIRECKKHRIVIPEWEPPYIVYALLERAWRIKKEELGLQEKESLSLDEHLTRGLSQDNQEPVFLKDSTSFISSYNSEIEKRWANNSLQPARIALEKKVLAR